LDAVFWLLVSERGYVLSVEQKWSGRVRTNNLSHNRSADRNYREMR